MLYRFLYNTYLAPVIQIYEEHTHVEHIRSTYGKDSGSKTTYLVHVWVCSLHSHSHSHHTDRRAGWCLSDTPSTFSRCDAEPAQPSASCESASSSLSASCQYNTSSRKLEKHLGSLNLHQAVHFPPISILDVTIQNFVRIWTYISDTTVGMYFCQAI